MVCFPGQKWKAAAFFKAAAFAEKLKQQPLIELWAKEVLRDSCCELPDGQAVTKPCDSNKQMPQPNESPKKLPTSYTA